MDVTNINDINAVKKTKKSKIRIDILINNATIDPSTQLLIKVLNHLD